MAGFSFRAKREGSFLCSSLKISSARRFRHRYQRIRGQPGHAELARANGTQEGEKRLGEIEKDGSLTPRDGTTGLGRRIWQRWIFVLQLMILMGFRCGSGRRKENPPKLKEPLLKVAVHEVMEQKYFFLSLFY